MKKFLWAYGFRIHLESRVFTTSTRVILLINEKQEILAYYLGIFYLFLQQK
jgi:hypothetical protein